MENPLINLTNNMLNNQISSDLISLNYTPERSLSVATGSIFKINLKIYF